MADNVLEGLRDAEERAGEGNTEGAEPMTGAELDASQIDPNAPADGDRVDPIVTRTEPELDEAAAAKADEPIDPAAYGGVALNAGSVDNKGQAPDAISQATGHSPTSTFPAPTPTRDSAVHQLRLKVAELKYHVSDWNHKLDHETQKLVDSINSL